MFKKLSVLITLTLFALFLLIPTVPVNATGLIYYVDSVNGSDSYDGLAGEYNGTSGPWKTFTDANSMTFQPGDKLLLKRGGVWNEWLQMHGQGTSSALIEIGAYGTGPRPIIKRNGNKTEDTLRWYDAAWAKVSSITVMDAGQGIRLTGKSNQSIMSTQTPTGSANDLRYELGSKFKASVNGQITKVRLYTHLNEGGDHNVRIWRVSDGVCVAGPYTWTITSGTAGWKAYALPTALNITANTDYIVSISNSTDKCYVMSVNGFDSPINREDLITYTGSGLFTQTLGTMPTSSYNNSNYFRDVVFVKSVPQGNLFIDDCIASNIKGRYGESDTYPQNEGWSEGISAQFSGSENGYLSTITNCEVMSGGGGILLADSGTIDRCYVHDAVCPTSGFVGIATVSGVFNINRCLLDNSTSYAAYGTSALMFQHNNTSNTSTFQNSIVRNTAHTGAFDETGLDFEQNCKNIVVDNVTFENNAGPSVEFLRANAEVISSSDIDIKNSRFIGDCWGKPWGISNAIYVGPEISEPRNVSIHDNLYTLASGTTFFGGIGDLSGCTLTNNVQQGNISYNHEPSVFAGNDKNILSNSTTLSDASASDDGGSVTVKWEQLSGPGVVTFDNLNAINTTVHFPANGNYVLRIVADDGTFWKSDYVNVMCNGQTIFTTQTPTGSASDLRYELGTKFKASVDGQIIMAKLYAHQNEGGDHSVRIWRVSDGVCVAGPYTWTITPGTAGWKAYTLPTALNITANTDYIVSISNSTDKCYVTTVNGFNSPINNQNLITYTGSGVFTQTLGTMPTTSYSNSNYFRDVVFLPN